MVHPTMRRNQWHLCLEVYRSTLIHHLFRHSTSSSWSLQNLISCLSTQALVKSMTCDQSFCLDALECSHSWCAYTVHSTLTGYVASHQAVALHSWLYHFWMSQEWTTAFRLTLRDQKEFQSSLPVWGYPWGRFRRTLLLVEVVSTSK